ncbi:MAG: L-alanine exporter AlaE [Nanoarchaeota archaeon]
MDNLEKIAGESPETNRVSRVLESQKRSLYQKAKDAVTNYAVDVSAGLMFYNPIMALGEYAITGMDGPEVLKARMGASVAQMICMRPSGMLRNVSAKHFNLTKESPWYQKMTSDVASILALQIPAYSLALYNAGASTGEWAKALGVAVAVTTISGRPFGKWMDFWRGIWGKKKAIK